MTEPILYSCLNKKNGVGYELTLHIFFSLQFGEYFFHLNLKKKQVYRYLKYTNDFCALSPAVRSQITADCRLPCRYIKL